VRGRLAEAEVALPWADEALDVVLPVLVVLAGALATVVAELVAGAELDVL
jgi:hypothetical protein